MAISSDKRKAFIEAYLDCLNGTEAARRAGYAVPRQEATRLLSNADIRAAIDEGLRNRAMSRDQVLGRLARIAEADVRDLFDFDPQTGKMTRLKLTRDAPLHLIRSITPTKQGLKVETHDPVRALELLGKFHALWTDRVKLDITPERAEQMTLEELDAEIKRRGLE